MYTFVAAERVPSETVFSFRWIASLESTPADASVGAGATVPAASVPAASVPAASVPFELDGRFGYVDAAGNFAVNRQKKANVYLSPQFWAEYSGTPEKIPVFTNRGEEAVVLENPRGYPFFLDDKIFLLNSEQYAISRLDEDGSVLWSRDFAAVITCVDAAAGIVAVGLLDGSVEIVGENGERLFYTTPTGSRIAAVFGCALSRRGDALAVVSGVDVQRFLYIERFAQNWRITHHEFLEDGLRRNVFVSFLDGGKHVLFEREDGAGIYDTEKRVSYKVNLDGRVNAVDEEGSDGIALVVSSGADGQKRLVAIAYPNTLMLQAPFKSAEAFLARRGSTVFVGGGGALAAFEIEKK